MSGEIVQGCDCVHLVGAGVRGAAGGNRDDAERWRIQDEKPAACRHEERRKVRTLLAVCYEQ